MSGAEAGNLRASILSKFKPSNHFQPVQIEHFLRVKCR